MRRPIMSWPALAVPAGSTRVRPRRAACSVCRLRRVLLLLLLACVSAGGIARALGMRRIFVHQFSGILSAYGMGMVRCCWSCVHMACATIGAR